MDFFDYLQSNTFFKDKEERKKSMHIVINKSFTKHFSKYAVSTHPELIEIVFCLKSFPYPSDSSHLSSTSLSKFYSL